ncbi:hypothetical protein PPERSA_08661 [Pseudocohnilembus persalinus]|uniref:Translation initiation factor eIF2B subunit beta n=1 Tax=Pseudocohnilembus persalinus TaxID=266149 RepID=A0A0V0R8N1_PSEPJ|nr:hypothetical protein PPERSA_08661 [Pseudocohnilembus persalinus]|eukprot:KRX10666.1 hypothetical protein PPERSA_08661 [Pseudocohnilembus persalinus]
MSNKQKLLDPLRQIESSHGLGIETCEIVKEMILKSKATNVEDLKQELTKFGQKVMKVHPLEFTVENVIRRINAIIDEKQEKLSLQKNYKLSQLNLKIEQNKEINQQQDSSLKLERQESDKLNVKQQFQLEKKQFSEDVDSLVYELTEEYTKAIEKYALEHVNENEVVLTYEYSVTVEKFLKKARFSRQFEVIILVKEQNSEAYIMAENLTKAGITAFLAPFSAAYAYMPRVNKIFLGCHAIMKNGGILGNSGSLMVMTAAKAYKIDVIILASSIKLTNHFSFEQNTYNQLLNPKDILPEENDLKNPVSIIAAKYDYIAPEYITLYITNSGEHSPNFIYRLFNEYY